MSPAPQFTGREFDPETGLYYYRSRYYAPQAGRFTTADPIGLLGGSNLYAYVNNNPINWIDPWGLDHLAESFSRTLKLPRANAEQLLEQVKTLELKPEWAAVPLRVQSGSLVRTFPQEQVTNFLSAKANEFLEKIKRKLEESPFFRESASGVVMVGELAHLEGFLEASEGSLNVPVRLGTVREVEIDSDLELGPQHTTVIGLLKHTFKRQVLSRKTAPRSFWKRCADKAHLVLEEYF